MIMRTIDLSRAGLGTYQRQRSRLVETVWVLCEWLLVANSLQPSSSARRFALSAFGAKVGRDVILRPRMRVKCPWNLTIGDRCWIGEGVWIHNQGPVVIGNDVVVSQESFVTTGSHDSRRTMDLVVKPVEIKDGTWIASRCMVLQGSVIGRNCLVSAGSVVSGTLDDDGVYRGNPAARVSTRVIEGVR